jgi:hypothetical protein
LLAPFCIEMVQKLACENSTFERFHAQRVV